MRTVILGERPAAIQALIESRRATGADRYDEVWEGDYHMAPAPRIPHARLDGQIAAIMERLARPAGLDNVGPFNLGRPDDYRIPDRGLLYPGESGAFANTAALAIEILSPDDETGAKLPFYAARNVVETLIVDPYDRSLTWLRLVDGSYVEVDHSPLLDVAVAAVADEIDWPPVG